MTPAPTERLRLAVVAAASAAQDVGAMRTKWGEGSHLHCLAEDGQRTASAFLATALAELDVRLTPAQIKESR